MKRSRRSRRNLSIQISQEKVFGRLYVHVYYFRSGMRYDYHVFYQTTTGWRRKYDRKVPVVLNKRRRFLLNKYNRKHPVVMSKDYPGSVRTTYVWGATQTETVRLDYTHAEFVAFLSRYGKEL